MVGQGLLKQAGGLISPLLTGNKVVIVSDSNVAPLYLAKLEASLSDAGIKHSAVTLTAGEKTKSFEHLQVLADTLFRNGIDRKTVLIALGGGVPVLVLLVAPASAAALMVALLAHITGMFVERWLFFAEAKHVVTLYYEGAA